MFICIIVRKGYATGATLHGDIDSAISEGTLAGDCEFAEGSDDISVFEVSSDGRCTIDRVWEYPGL